MSKNEAQLRWQKKNRKRLNEYLRERRKRIKIIKAEIEAGRVVEVRES